MASLRINNRRHGVVTLEMALITPLLILLIFGLLEYGWMFVKAHQINNAARHGVRIAAMPDASYADVTTAVASLMGKANLTGKYSITVTPSTDLAAYAPGDELTVVLSAPYSDISLVNFPLIPTPASLGASVTMVKEGP